VNVAYLLIYLLSTEYVHVMDGPTNGYITFMLLLYLYSSCNQLTISKATPFMDAK